MTNDKQPISAIDFSKKVKEKYPQYKDVDDLTLAKKMVEKYPEYKNQVQFDDVKKKDNTLQDSFEAPEQPLVLSKESGLGNKKSVPEKPTPLVDNSLVDKTPEDLSDLAYDPNKIKAKENVKHREDIIKYRNEELKKERDNISTYGSQIQEFENTLKEKQKQLLGQVESGNYNNVEYQQKYTEYEELQKELSNEKKKYYSQLKAFNEKALDLDAYNELTNIQKEIKSESIKKSINDFKSSLPYGGLDVDLMGGLMTVGDQFLSGAAGLAAQMFTPDTEEEIMQKASTLSDPSSREILINNLRKEQERVSQIKSNLIEYANSRSEASEERAETLGLVQQLGQIDMINSPMDGLRYSVHAAAEGAAQIPLAVATYGGSSFIMTSGLMYQEVYNQEVERLKTTGLSEEEAKKKALLDENVNKVGLNIGASMVAGLDLIGSSSVLGKSLTNEAKKKVAKEILDNYASSGIYSGLKQFSKGVGTEVLTENIQEGIEAETKNLVTGGKFGDGLKEITVEEAIEISAKTILGAAAPSVITALNTKKSSTDLVKAIDSDPLVERFMFEQIDAKVNDGKMSVEEADYLKGEVDADYKSYQAIKQLIPESKINEAIPLQRDYEAVSEQIKETSGALVPFLREKQKAIQEQLIQLASENETKTKTEQPGGTIQQPTEQVPAKDTKTKNKEAEETEVAVAEPKMVNAEEQTNDNYGTIERDGEIVVLNKKEFRQAKRAFDEQQSDLTSIPSEEIESITQEELETKTEELSNENNGAEVTQEESPSAEIASAEQKQEETEQETSSVKTVKTNEISQDPKRFQYKSDVDQESGVSEKLKGRKWNKDLSGVVSVWIDPKDGKTYVINGHHRLDLAKANGVENIDVRYIEANNEQEARRIGALQNIAEGQGSDLDAAKIFREGGTKQEDLEAEGLGLTDSKAQRGFSLSKLSQPIFDAVVRGDISTNIGVIIGNNIDGEAKQEQFYNFIKGKNLKTSTIEIMAQDLNTAPTKKEVTVDLFGTTEVEKADYENKANFVAGVRGLIAKAKNVLGKTAKSKEFLENFGNKIDKEKSEGASQEAAVAVAVFDQLRNSSPEISKLINEGLKRIENGESKSKVQSETARKVIDAAEGILNRKGDDKTSIESKKDKPKQDKEVKTDPIKQPSNKETVSEPKFQKESEEKKTNPSNKTTAKNREDLVEIGMNVFGLNEKQAKANAIIVDILIGKSANRQGISKEEMYAKIDWVKGDNDGAKGSIEFKDSRIIISAFQKADASTMLHEMAHVYENYLTEKEKQIVMNSQRVHELRQDGGKQKPFSKAEWTTETSEFFARSFEKYLADGKAPNVALQKIFDDFKKWLKKIYKGIKGSEIDIELNQPMTQLFDRIFKDEGAIASDREITSKVLFQMASKEGNLGLDIPNFIVKKGMARLKASYASGKSLEESIKDAINYFRKSKYSITQEKEVTFTDLVMAEIKGEKSDMREIGRIGETFSEQVQAVAEKNLEKRIELAEKARKKIEKHKQRIKERFRTKIKSDREAKSKFNELIKAIQKEAQIREIPTAVSNKLNRLLEGTLISNLDSKVDQAFLILQGVEYNQNLSKAKALIKQGKTKQKAARFSDSSGIIKNVLKINPKELTIPQLMEYISLLTDMRGKFLMKENEARLEKFQKIALDQLNNPKAKKELSEAQEKSLEERKNKQQEEKELRVKEVEFLQQQKQGELSEVAEKEYQFFQSITAEELNNLSLAEINSLIEGYQNLVDGFPINSSFVQASRKVKTARIVDTYLNATKSNKFKTLLRDRLNIFKRGLTKEKLERYLAEIPKNRIDDLVKGAKNKDLYESIIQPIEVGYSNHIAENDKIRKGFDKLFSKIPVRKREVEAIKLSLIAIEKEYQNNKPTQYEIGSSEVNPIADYIEASRLAASKDKSYESHYKKVKEVYESMLDSDGKFDYEIQEESLSKATKDVLVYAEQIGLQLADKIEVSAARNGDPITLRKYYTPLSVKVDKDINLKEILDRAEDFSMEPSLKTGRTKQRTPQGKALFFDFRENFLQASESISLDYHLREPLGTISAALNKLANSKDERFNENVSQEQVELAKAIAANLKQTTRDIFVNSYFDGKTWDRIKNLLKKRGYQMDLSSIPRAGVEFGSNTAFAMIYKPSELMQGLKHVKLFDKEGDIREFARLVETTQFTRLFDKSLSINQEVGSDLYTSSTMAGRLVDYVNDKTLSLPDRMIAQPLWIGSFYSEFKKATGVEFDAKKHNSDIEYRRENKEAIKKARDVADDNLAQSFATTNPYGGITNATITKDMSLFKAFTRYMTRFAKSEYQSLTDAINGAVGNNHLTKREGTALAFATIGRMGLYMWAMSMVGNMFYSGIAELGGWDDGEDEEEDLEKKAYRSVAGSIISLVLFRRLNNFQRIPLAIGVEYANAEFGDDLGLRESEALDPYKESLVYSTINSSYFTLDKGLLDGRPLDLTKAGNIGGSFAGPYNKLVKTLFRGADLSNRALYRKKKRTREAAKDELLTRTLPELFMETAGAPFSRDIKNMIIRNTFKEYRGKKKDGK